MAVRDIKSNIAAANEARKRTHLEALKRLNALKEAESEQPILTVAGSSETADKTADKTAETSSLPSSLPSSLADTLAVKQTVKQSTEQSSRQSSRQSTEQSSRQSTEQSTKQSSQNTLPGIRLDRLEGYERTSARWTKSESAVIGFFSAHRKVVITYDNLSISTGVAYGTLRMVIQKLERVGALKRTRVGRHAGQAYEFLGVGDQIEQPSRQSCQQSTEQSYQQSTEQLGEQSSPQYVSNINLLLLTQEGIDIRWEVLSQHGLTPGKLDELLRICQSWGLEANAALGMLDIAEWEAENGGIVDPKGKPVANPWAWVRAALIKTGYYRRPEGYKTGQELLEEDRLEEQKRIAALRKQTEELEFSNWWGSLTFEQQKEFDMGFVGGKKDAWRMAKWRSTIKKGQESLPAPGEG